MAELRIKRQDSFSTTFDVVNPDQTSVDCTGWEFKFTVRSSVPSTSTSDDSDAVISKTIEGSSTGTHTLYLDGDDTNITPGEYVAEMQAKDSSGDLHSTETFKLVIEADITRSS